jgi:glucose-1-phosphate thymidylyltransferase
VRANATVGPTAVLGRTAVGEGARVGAGATLRRSLVGQGARVGPGVVADARATDVVLDGTVHADLTVGCVVADRATVGGNVTLAPGSLVGAGATVADGATVTGRVDREAEVVR